MKNSLFNVLVAFLPSLLVAQSNAQWPFYLAFEDATGAVDTIWLVMDETAGYPEIDPDFGEIPISLNDTNFQVWMEDVDWPDLYSCFAVPLDGYQGLPIHGHNFNLPIMVSWDSALFNADILYQVIGTGINGAIMDNNYFPADGAFDMIGTDYVELPYFEIQGTPASHFPLFVSLSIDPSTISVRNRESIHVKLHPNPTNRILTLELNENYDRIEIYGLDGRRVLEQNVKGIAGSITTFDVSELTPGIYIIKTMNSLDGITGTGKFVKSDY